MIDTQTKKGQMLAGLIMGLAAAQALNADKETGLVPGALNLARLLTHACSLPQQDAIREVFVEDNDNNLAQARALHAHTPNPVFETLIESFSYEQLKEIAIASWSLGGVLSSMQNAIQGVAHNNYPEAYHKDMAAQAAERGDLELHVIDLSELFGRRPRQAAGSEPLPS